MVNILDVSSAPRQAALAFDHGMHSSLHQIGKFRCIREVFNILFMVTMRPRNTKLHSGSEKCLSRCICSLSSCDRVVSVAHGGGLCEVKSS